MRVGGQNRINASPSMFSTGNGPNTLESAEFARLSPITKTSPSDNLDGPKKLSSGISGGRSPRASFGVHARLETLLGEALFGHDRLGYLTRQHNVPARCPVRSRVARCATAARSARRPRPLCSRWARVRTPASRPSYPGCLPSRRRILQAPSPGRRCCRLEPGV
jgi:hypothetical protein